MMKLGLKQMLEDKQEVFAKTDQAFRPDKSMTTTDVKTVLDKAAAEEEYDTITFGLETEDGEVVKVYVKVEEADDFESRLSELIGQEDNIETVLDLLSVEFEIVDVEWPENEIDPTEEQPEEEKVDDENLPVPTDKEVLDKIAADEEDETKTSDDAEKSNDEGSNKDDATDAGDGDGADDIKLDSEEPEAEDDLSDNVPQPTLSNDDEDAGADTKPEDDTPADDESQDTPKDDESDKDSDKEEPKDSEEDTPSDDEDLDALIKDAHLDDEQPTDDDDLDKLLSADDEDEESTDGKPKKKKEDKSMNKNESKSGSLLKSLLEMPSDGWYVFDKNGNAKAGPYDDKADADAKLERLKNIVGGKLYVAQAPNESLAVKESEEDNEWILDANKVRFKKDSPYFAKGEFKPSQIDLERGKCWIGDSQDRGWYVYISELEPVESGDDDEYDDDDMNESLKEAKKKSKDDEFSTDASLSDLMKTYGKNPALAFAIKTFTTMGLSPDLIEYVFKRQPKQVREISMKMRELGNAKRNKIAQALDLDTVAIPEGALPFMKSLTEGVTLSLDVDKDKMKEVVKKMKAANIQFDWLDTNRITVDRPSDKDVKAFCKKEGIKVVKESLTEADDNEDNAILDPTANTLMKKYGKNPMVAASIKAFISLGLPAEYLEYIFRRDAKTVRELGLRQRQLGNSRRAKLAQALDFDGMVFESEEDFYVDSDINKDGIGDELGASVDTDTADIEVAEIGDGDYTLNTGLDGLSVRMKGCSFQMDYDEMIEFVSAIAKGDVYTVSNDDGEDVQFSPQDGTYAMTCEDGTFVLPAELIREISEI